MYVKAVREMGLYEIDDRSLPWLKHGMKVKLALIHSKRKKINFVLFCSD